MIAFLTLQSADSFRSIRGGADGGPRRATRARSVHTAHDGNDPGTLGLVSRTRGSRAGHGPPRGHRRQLLVFSAVNGWIQASK